VFIAGTVAEMAPKPRQAEGEENPFLPPPVDLDKIPLVDNNVTRTEPVIEPVDPKNRNRKKTGSKNRSLKIHKIFKFLKNKYIFMCIHVNICLSLKPLFSLPSAYK
jgi:hypothetical protein